MSRPTQGTANALLAYVYGIFTLSDVSFQNTSTSLQILYIAALQPQLCRNITGLGCSPFDRHY